MPNLQIVHTDRPMTGWTDAERSEIFRTRRVIQPLFGPLDVEFGETDQGHPWAVLAQMSEGTVVAHFARLQDEVIVDFPDLEIMGQGFTLREGLARILTECRHGPDLSGARRLLARIFDPAARPTQGLSIAWFLVAWEVMSSWARRWQIAEEGFDGPVIDGIAEEVADRSVFDAKPQDFVLAVTRTAASFSAARWVPGTGAEDGVTARGPVSSLASGAALDDGTRPFDQGEADAAPPAPLGLDVPRLPAPVLIPLKIRPALSDPAPHDGASAEDLIANDGGHPAYFNRLNLWAPDRWSNEPSVRPASITAAEPAGHSSHEPAVYHGPADGSDYDILHINSVDAHRLTDAGWTFWGTTTGSDGTLVSAFVSPTQDRVVLVPAQAHKEMPFSTVTKMLAAGKGGGFDRGIGAEPEAAWGAGPEPLAGSNRLPDISSHGDGLKSLKDRLASDPIADLFRSAPSPADGIADDGPTLTVPGSLGDGHSTFPANLQARHPLQAHPDLQMPVHASSRPGQTAQEDAFDFTDRLVSTPWPQEPRSVRDPHTVEAVRPEAVWDAAQLAEIGDRADPASDGEPPFFLDGSGADFLF
ncbi:MAG: hypothetical protein ACFB6R_01035 [Alphaproteobacteria bacterium]